LANLASGGLGGEIFADHVAHRFLAAPAGVDVGVVVAVALGASAPADAASFWK
jgi:hypothetical protein